MSSKCSRGLPLQDIPAPQLEPDVSEAFDVAFNNISAFHKGQQGGILEVETMPGVRCRRITRPVGECKRSASTLINLVCGLPCPHDLIFTALPTEQF